VVSRYLPVIEDYAKRPGYEGNLHWDRRNPYFYYPYIFVSPFVVGFKVTRKDFQKPEYRNDDLTIYADSGGFQIAVKHQKASVLDILRWQEGLADIAFTVDVPAYSYRDPSEKFKGYPRQYFERCLAKSVENAELMMSAKENEKMQLWAVLQGRNITETMEWYKAITKNYEFDGYCVAITAAVNNTEAKEDWISQLAITRYLDTNIHFLGRCEPLIALVLAKLSSVTGKTYTYDSSTSAGSFRWGKYLDPYFQSAWSLSKYEEKRIKVNMLPCNCPVCRKHTIEELADTKKGYLLYMHNVYVKVVFDKFANAIATDDDLFKRVLRKIVNSMNLSRDLKRKTIREVEDIIYNDAYHTEQSLSKFF